VRRPRDTPIWKLEAALRCRSRPDIRDRLRMIRLTETREIAPYTWVFQMTRGSREGEFNFIFLNQFRLS
jgi:hypothetical protein